MMARWSGLVIVVVGLVVWANTLDNQFQYDDIHSIVDNLHVRDLDSIGAFFTDPSTFSVDAQKGMYRPLLVTTYALNYAFGEYGVRGYHAVNVAIHLTNALLVWWLTGLLGARAPARLLAGLLFAVHPVCSEPVNYISSRSESLAAMFYLTGVAVFLRGQRGPWIWRLGVPLCLGAGLLTKSSVITLPAVLLALDYLLISRVGSHGTGRSDWRTLWRRIPAHHLPGWLVVAAYLAIVTGNRWLTRSLSQEVRSWWEQFLTQSKAVGYYLHLLVVPTRLSVEPQFLEQGEWTVRVALPLLLGISLAAGALWLWRRRLHQALFLLAWTALHMLPTTGVPLNVLVNERRAYVPAAIACIAAGLLLARGLRRLPARPALLVAATIVLGALSVQRNQAWANDFTLWGDAVRKAPLMARTHLYLGNAHKDAAYQSRGAAERDRHWKAASTAYERAHEVAGGDEDLALRALNNRGGVHFEMGREVGAAGEREEDRGRHELAARKYEEQRAEYARAETLWLQAAERNPRYADALINLGNSSLNRARELGQASAARTDLLRQSISYYQRALEVRPNHYQGHGNLGVAHEDLGQWEAAEGYYRHAIYLNPGDWTTHKNVGNLLYRMALRDIASGRAEVARGRLRDAQRLVRRALRLNPAVYGGREVLEAVEGKLRALGGR